MITNTRLTVIWFKIIIIVDLKRLISNNNYCSNYMKERAFENRWIAIGYLAHAAQ